MDRWWYWDWRVEKWRHDSSEKTGVAAPSEGLKTQPLDDVVDDGAGGVPWTVTPGSDLCKAAPGSSSTSLLQLKQHNCSSWVWAVFLSLRMLSLFSPNAQPRPLYRWQSLPGQTDNFKFQIQLRFSKEQWSVSWNTINQPNTKLSRSPVRACVVRLLEGPREGPPFSLPFWASILLYLLAPFSSRCLSVETRWQS